MVVTRYGIVATSQFLASQAGAKILEAGGNAVDAAIAANAVLGVTQPYVNGMGGDLFAIVYEAKTGKIYGLNSSGWTPKALTIDYLKSKQRQTSSIASASTPSPCPAASPDGTRCAAASAPNPSPNSSPPPSSTRRTDFRSPRSARAPGSARPSSTSPDTRRPTCPAARARSWATFSRTPPSAESLRQVAANGRDGYYKGKMAETLVKFLQAQGGAHTLEDFAEFQPEWVEPISTTYRGWQVYELPPNGQGVAALSMLNIMENFPLKDYGHNSAAALHVMIEAKKLAYADMARYAGDPRFGPVPVDEMLSKDLAKRRADLINMDKASCKVLPVRAQREAGIARQRDHLSFDHR